MINQHEANIVKYIFESYAKVMAIVKLPMHSIIKVMSLRRVIHLVFVTYILSNPFYIGKIQFAKYKDWNDKRRKGLNDKPVIAEGKHTPIISQDLWDKVQARKKQVSKSHRYMVKDKSVNWHNRVSTMFCFNVCEHNS